jgi:hypothetical protein
MERLAAEFLGAVAQRFQELALAGRKGRHQGKK